MGVKRSKERRETRAGIQGTSPDEGVPIQARSDGEGTTNPPTPPAKKKLGRPTKRTPELVARFLEEVAKARAVYLICQDEGMPSESAIYRWEDEDADFREKFLRARARAGNRLGWRMVEVGERVESGVLDPQAGRVAGEIYYKAARQLAPRDWGEKVKHEVEGNMNTTETRRVVIEVAGLSEEKQAVLAALAAGPKPLPPVDTTARDPGYTPTKFEEEDYQEPEEE